MTGGAIVTNEIDRKAEWHDLTPTPETKRELDDMARRGRIRTMPDEREEPREGAHRG